MSTETTLAKPAGSAARAARWLLLLLAVIVVASWLGSLVQTSNGRVEVTGFTLPTQNGQWVAADLYRPRSATKDAPAPLVVVVPGFQRTKETLANIAIELARRGVVAIAIDPYAQGASSASLSTQAATTEGYGMFAMVEYAASTSALNYVDKTRIAATGHSAGGNAAIRGANFFGKQAKAGGRPSVLHSVFVSGYVLTLTDNVLRDVRSNVGISYALYDEGAYRNELGHGDMRRAPEALRLVNSGRAKDEPRLSEIEPGRYYGDVAARNLRVVFNERVIHPLQPYDRESTANQIEFFIRVFGLQNVPPPADQIWFLKDLCGLVGLVAALLALVPFARLLLEIPWFARIVRPVPPASPLPVGAGRWVHWGVFVTGAAIACATYIPLCELSQQVFKAASNREPTWFFPQRMNNAVMMWAFINGLVGVGLFLGVYRFFGRPRGASPANWGAAISAGDLARTALLALAVYLGFFGLLGVVHAVWHVDYRFTFLGARPLEPVVFPQLAMYFPCFLVFFLSNSLRANAGLRFAGQPEWRGRLWAGLANSLGLLLIIVIQYATFARTGTVFWTDGWLYVNLLFGVVPMMFFLPFFHRAFFALTGRIYLGPLVMVLVFITMLLTNSVTYIPL